MPTNDLAALLSAAQTASAAQNKMAETAVDSGAIIQSSVESQKIANKQIGEANATLDTAKLQAVQAQEAARARAAADFGLNANAQGYLGAQYAEGIKQAVADQIAAADRIKQKNSVGFLDNPLQYIVNQLTIDEDQTALEVAKTKFNALSSGISRLETSASAVGAINAAATSTVTQASLDATKIKATAQAQAQIDALTIEGARSNLATVNSIATASMQQLSIAGNTFNARLQQEASMRAAESLAMQRKMFNLEYEAKKASYDAQETQFALMKEGYEALNGTPMPARMAENAKTFLAAKDPNALRWLESGIASRMKDPTGATKVISNSPYDALSYAQVGAVKNLTPAMSSTLAQLAGWKQEFENPAVQAGIKFDPKDKDATEKAFNQFVLGKMKNELLNVRPGSIVSALPLTETVKANPALAELPVWQKVLAPLAAGGAQLNDPSVIMGQIATAVVRGTITHPEAVQIAALNKAAFDLGNAARNFGAVGLPTPQVYNTKFLGVIDNIADPAVVSRQLLRFGVGAQFQQQMKQRSELANERLGNAN